jgi:hypothetical protein
MRITSASRQQSSELGAIVAEKIVSRAFAVAVYVNCLGRVQWLTMESPGGATPKQHWMRVNRAAGGL